METRKENLYNDVGYTHPTTNIKGAMNSVFPPSSQLLNQNVKPKAVSGNSWDFLTLNARTCKTENRIQTDHLNIVFALFVAHIILPPFSVPVLLQTALQCFAYHIRDDSVNKFASQTGTGT